MRLFIMKLSFRRHNLFVFPWESLRYSISKLKMDFPFICYLYSWQFFLAKQWFGNAWFFNSSFIKVQLRKTIILKQHTLETLFGPSLPHSWGWGALWLKITCFGLVRGWLILFSDWPGLRVGWRKAENSHFLAALVRWEGLSNMGPLISEKEKPLEVGLTTYNDYDVSRAGKEPRKALQWFRLFKSFTSFKKQSWNILLLF